MSLCVYVFMFPCPFFCSRFMETKVMGTSTVALGDAEVGRLIDIIVFLIRQESNYTLIMIIQIERSNILIIKNNYLKSDKLFKS